VRPAAAHVHLKLDRLINGRYYTAEQQRRAAAGQAFHCSTGHTNFQYLRFALTNGTFDAILECFGCDSRAGKFIIAQQI
jgi:hypothetical protein